MKARLKKNLQHTLTLIEVFRTFVLIATVGVSISVTFFMTLNTSLRIGILYAIFFLFAALYKLRRKDAVWISAAFLIFAFVCSVADAFVLAEKFAIQAFFFFGYGVVLNLVHYRRQLEEEESLLYETLTDIHKTLFLFFVSLKYHLRSKKFSTKELERAKKLFAHPDYQVSHQLLANTVDVFEQITVLLSILTSITGVVAFSLLLRSQFTFFKNFFTPVPFWNEVTTHFYSILLIICAVVGIVLVLIAKKAAKFFPYTVTLAVSGILLASILLFNQLTVSLRTMPHILDLSHHKAQMWTGVRIYGQNFGEAQYETSKVQLIDKNGRIFPQRVLRWSKSEIIFVVDPNTTPTGNIQVLIEDRVSNPVEFTYVPI